MGNFPACLYSSELYNSSSREDLSKPLLCRPCTLYSGKLHLNIQGGVGFPSPILAPVHAPQADKLTKDNKHLKVIKKVRFADQVMLISTSNYQEIDPLISSANNGESEELFHRKKDQRSMFINSSTILIDEGSRVVNQSSNIVRLKVVISKKEFSELLKTREEEGSDALMERILGPLLSPESSCINKSQTLNAQQYGNPTWRPNSLEHISEDH